MCCNAELVSELRLTAGCVLMDLVSPAVSGMSVYASGLKNVMIDKVLRKKIVSVNFRQVLFSLLYFVTLEAGTYRLS